MCVIQEQRVCDTYGVDIARVNMEDMERSIGRTQRKGGGSLALGLCSGGSNRTW